MNAFDIQKFRGKQVQQTYYIALSNKFASLADDETFISVDEK